MNSCTRTSLAPIPTSRASVARFEGRRRLHQLLAERRERPGTEIRPKEIKPSDIKKIRAEAGLTQEKMAKKLGVSENTVGNWETGSARPRGKNLEKLLKMRGD